MAKTVVNHSNNSQVKQQDIIGLTEHGSALRTIFLDSPSMVFPPSLPFTTSDNIIHRIDYEDEKYLTDINLRSARLTDLEAIETMVKYWAELGENLPRQQHEIVRDIGSFVVFEQQGIVTGCASLHAYDSRLAEIRSLGIDPDAQGQGQGRAIVGYLVEKARQMAFQKVFVLTRAPEFFKKQGFLLTSRELLPEKIMKDCARCPRQHTCDEVALEVCF